MDDSMKVQAKCWRCKVEFQKGCLKEKEVLIEEMKKVG